jgi:hypothetical protein
MSNGWCFGKRKKRSIFGMMQKNSFTLFRALVTEVHVDILKKDPKETKY